VISGSGRVFKTVAGTVTFTQPQPYTGLTEVGVGELCVAGLGGSALVDARATLSGTGTIAGNLAVSYAAVGHLMRAIV
jgi:hypothetical protein